MSNLPEHVLGIEEIYFLQKGANFMASFSEIPSSFCNICKGHKYMYLQ